MEADEHEKWVRSVAKKVRDSGVSPPARHVLDRLARLLGYADVDWVDGHLKDEHMRMAGVLVLFTDRVVAVADMSDIGRLGDGFMPGPDEGRVNVRIYPRRSLRRIEVLMPEEGDRQNSGWNWARLQGNGEPQDTWPWNCPIELVYDDHVRIVVNDRLRDDRHEDMADFMATLVSDLNG